jgi:ATP-dependent Lon protease
MKKCISKKNLSKNLSKDKEKDKEKEEMIIFVKEKIKYIQQIIQNTIISIQNYKKHEIFTNGDINICMNKLNELYNITKNILQDEKNEKEDKMVILQDTIDKLSRIICSFGTLNMEDLLFVTFGSEYIKNILFQNNYLEEKFEIIKKYFHPTGYKTILLKPTKEKIHEKSICIEKMTEETIDFNDCEDYECFENDLPKKSFLYKINGIRIILKNEKHKKLFILYGVMDDIPLHCFSNLYIDKRKQDIQDYLFEHESTDKEISKRMIESMSIKDILIHGNRDMYKKQIEVYSKIQFIKITNIEIIVKKFMDMDILMQRDFLIQLLIYNKEDEIKYVVYLLYDIIAINTKELIDSNEQILIYDSFPWIIKNYFKESMKLTVKFSQELSHKYDVSKITLEQQIYLLKASDNVKEKAILKLKEIKGKTDDVTSKAKQYLEGLLKIPFGIFKEEPILKNNKKINEIFYSLIKKNPVLKEKNNIQLKPKYTNMEILKYIHRINQYFEMEITNEIKKENLESIHSKQLACITKYIKKEDPKFISKGTNSQKIENCLTFLKKNSQNGKHNTMIYDIINKNETLSLTKTREDLIIIKQNIKETEKTMNTIIEELDHSVYAHNYAKSQILKIIAQWISGEQTGYCFGFEGSPGIGKTSLAKKGLSQCLKDELGISRPFSFIALGGSCNGSTLEGHSYTYVNSIWGRIVDILMETKCMNPIIYIDELDKVSKTENGKEIIGILTHLIDSTQNTAFHDKYFSGIDLDLSKVLFIFSYNDPENIDRILLDRIHRIKFDNLSLYDKIVIVEKYILPDINTKMGFCNIVKMDKEIIEYIIETYTHEPGVRKLKEVLFDLFGEINIELLKYQNSEEIELPITITEEVLTKKYLKKYHKNVEKKIHQENKIGVINGLWANSMGKGGIIPIETLFFPSSTFLELRLTGLQGDVMKESMNVAKTLAWNLTDLEKKKEWLIHFDQTKSQGLHIHCPEGAISKDGPSAGAAITLAIISLFSNRKIKNDVAITGEINLQGEITAIGGLEYKIIGGIHAGIKTFLYPKANHNHFMDFKEKYEDKISLKNINFIEISMISETFSFIFVE